MGVYAITQLGNYVITRLQQGWHLHDCKAIVRQGFGQAFVISHWNLIASKHQDSRIWRLQAVSTVAWQGDSEGRGALPERANASSICRQRQRQALLRHQALISLYTARCSVSLPAASSSSKPCQFENCQKRGPGVAARRALTSLSPTVLPGLAVMHAPTTHRNTRSRDNSIMNGNKRVCS